MKVCTTAVLLLVGLASAGAQGGSQTAPAGAGLQQTAPAGAPQAKIDPAKEADILRLLDLSGARQLAVDTMDSMFKSIRPLMVSSLPPGEYRGKLIDLFIAKFHSKADVSHFLQLALPIYDKYFSPEEIKSLIAFYETPIGQKTISVLPKLMTELRAEGEKWGRTAGHDSMQEVVAEHPDLEAALEAATKAARTK